MWIKTALYIIYAIVLIYLLYTNPKTFLLLTGLGLLYYAIEEQEDPIKSAIAVAKVGGGDTSGRRKLGHKTEKMLLQVLHSRGYTGFKPNQKPDWLKLRDDVSGALVQLELDLYDSENNVAIEYNGPQHYSADNRYWPDFYSYAKYIKNSVIKAEICQSNGVELVVVPYTVPIAKLYDYTKSRFWDNRYIRDTYGMNKPRGSKYMPEQKIPIEKINEILTGVVSRDLHEAIAV